MINYIGQNGLNFIAAKYKELRDLLSGYAKKEDLDTKISKSQMSNQFTIASDDQVLTTQGSYNLYNQLYDYTKTKVDKENGKQLSTNDYTNEAKAKVDAIPADPKYTDTVQDLSKYVMKEKDKAVIPQSSDLSDTEWSVDNKYATPKFLSEYVSINASNLVSVFKFFLEDKADRKEIKRKLSEMTDDATHRLVTDTEKTTWNNKVEKTDLSKYKQQVILTQAEYDALSSANKNDGSKIYFIKE